MIVSTPRPHATHVASDSMAAVIKAMGIIEDNIAAADQATSSGSGTSSSRKPWLLQPDGDLWYTFECALRAKGFHSFRATWVKGHVTLQAMRDDPRMIPDAIDNGVADLIAGAGAKTAGTTVQSQLLGYYAAKQCAYAKLTRAIVNRILRVSDEVRDRRDAIAKLQGAQPRHPIH